MSSRDDILASVRRNAKTVAPDLPDLEADWIQYADLQQQFSEVIETVGGRCVAAESDHDINNALKAIPEYSSASKIASTIPGIGESNVSLSEIDDPHELEDVDFAILPGEFAVAENGAVWGHRQRSEATRSDVYHAALGLGCTRWRDRATYACSL